MKLLVAPDVWGEGSSAPIEMLLRDVASHLLSCLRDAATETICVVRAPPFDPNPRTRCRESSSDPIVIQLNTSDTFWAQYSYQFSHEFCHALQPYEALYGTPNSWFHEALCELASLFVLRRMAKTWRTNPPCLHRASFSEALADYVANLLADPKRRLPPKATLPDWLALQEDSLRKDHEQRDKNAVMASELLPLFENDPSGWNTVRRFPPSSSAFKDYLLEWRSQVDPMDQPFVDTIVQRFKEPA